MSLTPDRDKGSGNCSLDSEFSFKQLPHYVDAKINSLLQGVIGLPSALSRRHSDLGQSYLVDDSPEQEKCLRMPRNACESHPEKPLFTQSEIPVKKFTSGKLDSHENDKSSGIAQGPEDNIARDLPLYSPVSKALFAHLQHYSDTNTDGTQTDRPRTMTVDEVFIYHPYSVHRKNLSMIQDAVSSKTPNLMKIIQRILYNELDRSCVLRSGYSLLPYLSFSPYSPLKLSSDAKNDPKDAHFPYCHAFRDLIETSFDQGKITGHDNHHERFVDTNFKIKPGGSVQESINWIRELYYNGILQQKEDKHVLHLFQKVPFINYPPTNEAFSLQRELDKHISLGWPLIPFGEKNFLDSVFNGFWGPVYEGDEKSGEKIRSSLDTERYYHNLESLSTNDSKSKVIEQNSGPENISDRVVSSSTSVIQNFGPNQQRKTIIEHRNVFADGRETVRTTFKDDSSSSEIEDQMHIEAEDRKDFKTQKISTSYQNLDISSQNPDRKRFNWLWK
ncbi:hypothetical protein K3495_g655 [Podosphaera aphanis]|nr:hypothetical protein K3495_g655 [Podosphaera aphanis]